MSRLLLRKTWARSLIRPAPATLSHSELDSCTCAACPFGHLIIQQTLLSARPLLGGAGDTAVKETASAPRSQGSQSRGKTPAQKVMRHGRAGGGGGRNGVGGRETQQAKG